MGYYVEKDVSSDSVTISTNQAHSASHSFKLTTSGTRIELDLFPGNLITTDFYYSAWYYVPSSFNVGSYFTIFQLEGSLTSGYYPIWAFMFSSGDEHALLYGRGNSGTQLGNGGIQADSSFILPRDTWFKIEWYTHIASGNNGEIIAWANGNQLWDVHCDTSGLTLSTLYFMPMIYGSTGTIYVDDIAMYNYKAHT